MYRPQGYIQVCEMYLQHLLTRKTVALFSNYKEAKEDILLEFCSRYDKENFEAIKTVISHFETLADTQEYFNDI